MELMRSPPPFGCSRERKGQEGKGVMSELMEFFRQMLPVKKEAAWGGVTGVIGSVESYLFGAWNAAFETLVVLMVADYISGVLAAYENPGMMLDSRAGFRGICKKIMILLLVCVAHFVDNAIGQTVACTAVIWFFIGNEGLSILENAAKMGVPIPRKLRDTLQQLTSEKEERKEDAR